MTQLRLIPDKRWRIHWRTSFGYEGQGCALLSLEDAGAWCEQQNRAGPDEAYHWVQTDDGELPGVFKGGPVVPPPPPAATE